MSAPPMEPVAGASAHRRPAIRAIRRPVAAPVRTRMMFAPPMGPVAGASAHRRPAIRAIRQPVAAPVRTRMMSAPPMGPVAIASAHRRPAIRAIRQPAAARVRTRLTSAPSTRRARPASASRFRCSASRIHSRCAAAIVRWTVTASPRRPTPRCCPLPTFRRKPIPWIPNASRSSACTRAVDVHAMFPNGIDFSNPKHRCFRNVQSHRTDPVTGDETETFDSIMEGTADVGNGPQHVTLDRTCDHGGAWQGRRHHGDLGYGDPVHVPQRQRRRRPPSRSVRARACPLRGRYSGPRMSAEAKYQIDSFFDVYHGTLDRRRGIPAPDQRGLAHDAETNPATCGPHDPRSFRRNPILRMIPDATRSSACTRAWVYTRRSRTGSISATRTIAAS